MHARIPEVGILSAWRGGPYGVTSDYSEYSVLLAWRITRRSRVARLLAAVRVPEYPGGKHEDTEGCFNAEIESNASEPKLLRQLNIARYRNLLST